MAFLHFKNVGIRAVAACVPSDILTINSLTDLFTEKEAETFISGTGVQEKRIASSGVCTSDLCYAAAKKLLEDNEISPDSIDAILFMSKTPDYIIPTTSALLQDRLGLNKSVLAMDLRLACSGYVYALSTAYAYASTEGIDRVLLLCGDVNSKIVSRKDKSAFPVFGDGGSATLIEKGDFADSFFDFGTDGSRAFSVSIPSENGGRNPITENSLIKEADGNGNVRNQLQMNMHGMDVFSFAISTVPKSIKSVIEFSKQQVCDIDNFFIHQANRFIIQTVAKKLKIQMGKVPVNIDRFGNTSSASIPLLLCSEFYGQEAKIGKSCMCGFGSGLSWASAVQDLSGIKISKIVEI